MLNEVTEGLTLIINQTKENLPLLLKIVSIPWFVYLINLILNQRLLYLGILPRHFIGLPGIFFAPLLHANFNHLFFNTIPLIVLCNFVLLNGFTYFLVVTFCIMVISGLLIWIFGKSGLHIGASALITGYWGLLVSSIFKQQTAVSVILGIICIYYFFGIFLGIFPSKKGISWEGHLFGLLAGLVTSYFLPDLINFLIRINL